jgi:hypothetical protein
MNLIFPLNSYNGNDAVKATRAFLANVSMRVVVLILLPFSMLPHHKTRQE